MDVNSKQVPIITIHFPPMPNFKDFEYDNYFIQMDHYKEALAAWKEVCKEIAKSMNLK